MSEGQGAGCVRPTAAAAVTADTGPENDAVQSPVAAKKEQKMIHVGHKAPDFSAPGYHKGKFVDGIKVSDYHGKWLLLCFYPGDFTFV